MPIYEYQCQQCDKRTEAIQRLDDPPLALCPHCGGPLTKLMSAPSFQFKGSGWYVTDYGGKSGGEPEEPKSSEKTEKATSKTSESTSSTSSSSSGEKKSSSS